MLDRLLYDALKLLVWFFIGCFVFTVAAIMLPILLAAWITFKLVQAVVQAVVVAALEARRA